MHSFVVRVHETRGTAFGSASEAFADAGQLRGVLEAVATGERRPFRSADELVCALRCGLERAEGLVVADLDHAEHPAAEADED